MNDLEQKIHDVIKILEVKLQEVKGVEGQRIALENSQVVASQREERLNDREVSLVKRENDIASQQKYIDAEYEKHVKLLATITKERDLLKVTGEERQKYDRDLATLEIREKTLIQKTEDYEKDKLLLSKQDESVKEYQRLLTAREKRITAKEESLDNIERKLAI